MINLERSIRGAALKVEGLAVGYGKLPVLDGLALEVRPGEVLAVIGPNGAGKSTLARAISGLLKVSSGSISLDGVPITDMKPSDIAGAGVLHVAETRDIFGDMTVWENLKIAFDNLDPRADETAAFERVYALFPILQERHKQLAGNLSGGQQQMLAIGRALLGKPRLLLLDEPSLGLARIVVAEIYKTLEGLRSSGMSILLIEQAAATAIRFADRTVIMVEGELVMQGGRDEMTGNGDVVRHYLGATA